MCTLQRKPTISAHGNQARPSFIKMSPTRGHPRPKEDASMEANDRDGSIKSLASEQTGGIILTRISLPDPETLERSLHPQN